MNVHGDFVWYELMTPDPAGSRRFYEAVAGWKIDERGVGEIDYRMIAAPDGFVGGLLTLTQDMQSSGARPLWIGYIGVDDVDATVRRIEDSGGKVQLPPRDIASVGRLAMVTDPQGAPFYVMRGVSDESSHAYSRETLGHCAWNELSTNDQAAALDFYTRLFGWKDGGVMPMGDMGNYQFINQSDAMFGAIMTVQEAGRPPSWTYYFRVADVSAAAETARAEGGQVLHGPQEVPGGDHIIVGADPQGAIFALVGAKG